MRDSPSVLLVAYACDPHTPSEPYIGWAFLSAVLQASEARGSRVHLLTNGWSARATLAGLPAEMKERVRVHAIALPRLLRKLDRPGIGLGARVAYVVWNHRARRYLRVANWTRDVAVAHHVTFATEMLPTPINVLPSSVYKAWGPLGSEGNARVFLLRPRTLRVTREAVGQVVRDGASTLAVKVFARGLDLIVAQSRGVELRVQAPKTRAETFPNLILPEEPVVGATRPAPSADAPLQLLAVGHFIERKRFDLAVESLCTPEGRGMRLTMVGAAPGNSKVDLPRLAAARGVADRVTFVGKLPRHEVLRLMLDSDVLVHPAGREGAPGVIGEAISMGLPVVCFEGTGAAQVVLSVPGSGIVLEAKGNAPRAIALAAYGARQMSRQPSNRWGFERLVKFMEETIVEPFL